MNWRAGETAYDDHVVAADTLSGLWADLFERHAHRTAQRYKGGRNARSLVPGSLPEVPAGTYGDVSYEELGELVRTLGRGIRSVGMEPGDRVAIFAPTRMEWALTDLAITCAGGIVTTVYDNATPNLVEHQIEDAGAIGVVVGGTDEFDRVRNVETDLGLSFTASMDEVDDPDCISLEALCERGREADDDVWPTVVAPDDVATIVYTSGTTGTPAGVALTHRNLCANIGQIRRRFAPRPDCPADLPRIDHDTVALSFLPLAHILERTAGHYSVLAAGGTIAYAESVETIRNDLQLVRPTTIVGVPRVYERFDEAMRRDARNSAVRSRLLEWAIAIGERHRTTAEPGPSLDAKRRLADRLVGRRVRAALGGRIELLICGGSRLDPSLCARYHALGLPLIEGYGLTETAPVVTVNPVEAPIVGSIGPPVHGVEVAIDTDAVDVDDAGAAGELLVRGANVAAAYWNREEPITDADADGWFHTGDLVRERPGGYFEFVERADELIVLSTGQKVAPRPIEATCRGEALVRNCLVMGTDEKFVSALIVPDGSVAVERGLVDTPTAAADAPAVQAAIEDVIAVVNRNLEPDERIKAFRLVNEPFTVKNGLQTPTLKKKRRAVADRYATEVAAIYRG